MKKIVTMLSGFIFLFCFAGCKQTESSNQVQNIEIVKVLLGKINLLYKKSQVEINNIPQELTVETNIEIAKSSIEIIALDSVRKKYETDGNGKKIIQSIEDFEEGENILKITVEDKHGNIKEFSKKIIYDPYELYAVVYINQTYNQVKNNDQLITIQDSNATVFVRTGVPLTSATLDDGSPHKMNIDTTGERKTASFSVPISSTEKKSA